MKKVQLPTGWKKLGLSDEQKKKIYALRRDYAVKIKKLSDQIDALRKEESGELGKLLTEEQKVPAAQTRLGEGAAGQGQETRGEEVGRLGWPAWTGFRFAVSTAVAGARLPPRNGNSPARQATNNNRVVA